MRIKNITDKYVTNRLIAWGDWFSAGRDSRLGYASKNIIQKLREQCGEFIRGANYQSVGTNEEAEEIESIVMQLHQDRPKYADVLRVRYFYQDDHEERAIRKGYTRSLYYSTLQLAHERIIGYFHAARNKF